MQTKSTIEITQYFPVDRETVWAALTEIDEIREWYFPQIPEFKAEKGFKTGFDVEHKGKVYPHRWQICEVEENRVIA